MKKSKIILIIVFLIAALAVLYFAYGVVKKRYLPLTNNTGTTSGETQNQTANPSADQSADNQENVSSDINNTAPTNGQPDVQSSDCENNCAKFKDNEEDFKYCQEICGDIPVAQKNSEEDCADLTGLEKDYCWRDLAVSKKDTGICDKISDAKLRKVCRNRVVEEILN